MVGIVQITLRVIIMCIYMPIGCLHSHLGILFDSYLLIMS